MIEYTPVYPKPQKHMESISLHYVILSFPESRTLWWSDMWCTEKPLYLYISQPCMVLPCDKSFVGLLTTTSNTDLSCFLKYLNNRMSTLYVSLTPATAAAGLPMHFDHANMSEANLSSEKHLSTYSAQDTSPYILCEKNWHATTPSKN